MQKINKTFEESKDKKNLQKQFGKLINDSFDLLGETLKFNDANINHEEVRNNILKDIPFKGYNVWILICLI